MFKLISSVFLLYYVFSSVAFAKLEEAKAKMMERMMPLVEELKISADNGDAEAQFQLGTIFSIDPFNDDKNAIKYLKLSADQGHCFASTSYGMILELGWKSAKKDEECAFEYFHKNAENGCVLAQKKLGDAYSDGEGVKKDYPQALEWYKKAALAGEPISAYHLGRIYNKGKKRVRKKIKKDLVEAFYWYTIAYNSEAEGPSKTRVKKLRRNLKRKLNDEQIQIVEKRVALYENEISEQWRNYIGQ